MNDFEFDSLLEKYASDVPDVDDGKVKPSILVIDDDESMRRGLQTGLTYKYNVIAAPDGPSGIEILNKSFCCVILDVKMKGMSGFEVYPALKKKCPEVPIVFFTAFQSEHDLQEIINKFKPDGYIEKGRGLTLLENLIEQSIEKYRLVIENEAYKNNLEQKVAQRTKQLEETQAQLLTAEKLASIGQLSAGIAHEINNPAVAFNRGVIQLKTISSEVINTCDMFCSCIEQYPELLEIGRQICSRTPAGQKLSSVQTRLKAKEIAERLKKTRRDDTETMARDIAKMDLHPSHLDLLFRSDVTTDGRAISFLKLVSLFCSVVHTMEISADRIIKITSSLKRYSHMDQAPEGDINVVDSIEDTLTILQNHLKYDIEVIKNFHAVSPVECYPAELGQVWTNLIMNAVQAIENRGTIEINVDEDPEHIIVSITDSGCGIPDDIKARIFDPFFSTKTQSMGTGLGLSIVYKIIVEKHKGRIELDSNPGKTAFTVYLPKKMKGAEK